MKRLLLIVLLLFSAGCDQLKTVEHLPPVTIIQDIGQPYQSYLDAACRVRAGNSGGSGICFKEDALTISILTNRHVVGSNKTAVVEFWYQGKVSKRIPAEVSKVFEIDVAILVVKKSDIVGQPAPKPISISAEEPKNGDVITTVGCPSLGWAGLWVGRVTGKNSGGAFSSSQKNIIFIPPPKGGQSGSGVFKDGKIVGLLWGSSGESGSAVSCTELNRVLNGSPDSAPKVKPPVRPWKKNYYFYSNNCAPCKKMTPIIEELRKEGIDIESVDIDNPKVQYGIDSTPSYANSKDKVDTGIKSRESLRKFYGGK